MSLLEPIPAFITMTPGFAVFLIGAEINARVAVPRQFNIPEPVTGGLLAALFSLALYLVFDITVEFDLEERDFFLVLFFACIGLNARLSDLIAGGKPLILLLLLTLLTILAQNVVGVLGATLFGYAPQVGVLFGSASLIGGHGTAIAWAPDVTSATGLESAPELGVAVATLGLVLAALVGGSIAKYLVEKNDLTPERPDEELAVGVASDGREHATPVNHLSLMRVMLYLNIAIILGFVLNIAIEEAGLKLPLFVPCLTMGIVIAIVRSIPFPRQCLSPEHQHSPWCRNLRLGHFWRCH